MINLLANDLNQLLSLPVISEKDRQTFFKRIAAGKLTRDENEESHFCIYFAAFDPHAKQVFIGHHRKSGLWLFNGGHIDRGEILDSALKREISEEWGVSIDLQDLGIPSLLTLTKIKENSHQECKWHYDIWYFVKLDKHKFSPVSEKLKTEFSEWKWFAPEATKKLVTDPNTLKVLGILQKQFNNFEFAWDL